MRDTNQAPLIEKIGAQLFWVQVDCYKNVRAAIERVEAEGMTIMNVIPLADTDELMDEMVRTRAVILVVAVEARELTGGNTNAGPEVGNAG